ncbi:MAG: Uncharacterised protein [Pseudidiomarina mangrovi]|nr:MAG: Uncharacterised protein [Pseudidiomarina mangrovi]
MHVRVGGAAHDRGVNAAFEMRFEIEAVIR